MAQFLRIASIFLIFIANLEAMKILVSSPSVSRSHLISNARVADALARDGHDVTLLEIEYVVPLNALNASKVAKVWRIPGKFLRFTVDNEDVDLHKMVVKMAFQRLTMWSAIKKYFFFSKFMNSFPEACERMLTSQKEQLELLKAEKFDLIIGEQFDFCSAGLAHLFQIPTYILLSSCPIQENVASMYGLPSPSSWVPTMESDNSDKMTAIQRLKNFLKQMLVVVAGGEKAVQPTTDIFRKYFGEDFPNLLDIVKRSPFVFVNADEFVDFPRPLFSNIIYIGGLGIENGKGDKAGIGSNKTTALKEPFLSEMSKGTKGVILFSFGSIIRSTDLPETFRRNIFEAFSHFPEYHFIIRDEGDDNITAELVSKMANNVFLTKWLPQIELLNHPRLRLFISHGGYNSLMETAHAGVPLIAMGFFADQFRNARVAERNGWALAFDKMNLLEGSGEFCAAIAKVLGEESFKTNAKRIKRLMATKPFSAEERLQRSIRFLEENGGELPELMAHSQNMSTIALYNLDLIFLGILATAFLLGITVLMVRLLLRKILWPIMFGLGQKTQLIEKNKYD